MSTYRTNHAYVLYTVLDNKLLSKLAKQYKKQIDKLFNKEEQVQVRNIRTKIGKEFLVPSGEHDELSEEFDIEGYIRTNISILKKQGLEVFLSLHGWTLRGLCEYITQTNSLLRPVTTINFQ